MKCLFAVTLVCFSTIANAQTPGQEYQSCDIPAQHAVTGATGGHITDIRQAHISVRANVLEADLGAARKAGRLTKTQAAKLFSQVEAVRHATDGFVKKQGFLSAAERASYDRDLDAVATWICRP